MPLVCELKYCECCGALMVRHSFTRGDYCAACEQLLLDTALPIAALRALLQRRKSSARRPRSSPLPADTHTQLTPGRPS